MMRELVVDLYGVPIGHLVGDDWRRFDFVADRTAFEEFDLGGHVLSATVPLVLRSNRAQAARRRNYFAELLPEGQILADLAARARVAEFDVPNMLSAYGRDAPGAVQIYDATTPGEPRVPSLTPLTSLEVEALLVHQQSTPLGNAPLSGTTSLAGVQAKTVLARTERGWNQVHDGYPSTHIAKPETAHYPTIIFDEEYGSRLARRLGVLDYEVWIESFGDVAALVIERFDRNADSPDGRVHQEDFCQALGVPRTQKYQEQGGAATLARVAKLVRDDADRPSLELLARMVVLSVAIGNVDMHLKNISILRPWRAPARLAPSYDAVPLRHLPNDGRMALAINSVYQHADLTAADLELEFDTWRRGLGSIVRPTLDSLAAAVEDEVPHARAAPPLRGDIAAFIDRLRSGEPAGDPPGEPQHSPR